MVCKAGSENTTPIPWMLVVSQTYLPG